MVLNQAIRKLLALLRIESVKLITPKGDYLKLTVEDNGIGITEQRISEVRSRLKAPSVTDDSYIGLRNVLTRVQLYFNDDATLRLTMYIPKACGSSSIFR